MDQASWNDEFETDPEHVDVADHVLVAEVAELPPGPALDLGCGSGKNTLKLAELGWSAVGVDWADRGIALAEQHAGSKGLDATFIVADVTQWKPERQFDLVVSTYALPGGDASRRVLATAADAVAPGGTLIVAEWDRSMAEVWGFDADDLTTPDAIAALLPGLAVECAELRRFEMFAADDPRAYGGSVANVAFVRARRAG